MTKKKKTLFAVSVLLALIIALAITSVASADDPPPPPTEEPADLPAPSDPSRGLVDGTGTHFEVTDSDYLNVTLDSTESVSLTLHSSPDQIIVAIRPVSEALSTQVTVGGLPPSTTFYKYEDDAGEPTTFTTDASGNYVFAQDLTAEHLVRIQPNTSTWFLADDATGGDCTSIGTWNASTKTCTLTTDVTETVVINSNDITLDGHDR